MEYSKQIDDVCHFLNTIHVHACDFTEEFNYAMWKMEKKLSIVTSAHNNPLKNKLHYVRFSGMVINYGI